jgi:hypothetical protein
MTDKPQFHFTPEDCKAWQKFFKARGIEVETWEWHYLADCWRIGDYKLSHTFKTWIPAYTDSDIIRGLREMYYRIDTAYLGDGRKNVGVKVWPRPEAPTHHIEDTDIYAALNELRKRIEETK